MSVEVIKMSVALAKLITVTEENVQLDAAGVSLRVDEDGILQGYKIGTGTSRALEPDLLYAALTANLSETKLRLLELEKNAAQYAGYDD